MCVLFCSLSSKTQDGPCEEEGEDVHVELEGMEEDCHDATDMVAEKTSAKPSKDSFMKVCAVLYVCTVCHVGIQYQWGLSLVLYLQLNEAETVPHNFMLISYKYHLT